MERERRSAEEREREKERVRVSNEKKYMGICSRIPSTCIRTYTSNSMAYLETEDIPSKKVEAVRPGT